MLTELVMQDFKAFHSERVQLKPLTVLVGENNSGKSSLIAAIRLLAQTIQAPDWGIPLLFDGIFGDFGTFKDVVHGNHRGRPLHLGLTIASFDRQGTRPARAERQVRTTSFLSEFKYRIQRRETVLRSTKVLLDQRHLYTVGRPTDGDRDTFISIRGLNVPNAVRAQLSNRIRMYNFIPFPRSTPLPKESRSDDVTRFSEILASIDRDAYFTFEAIREALGGVEVIGAMRQPPSRTYLHSGVASRRIGVGGENWGSLVALAVSGRGRSAFMEQVTSWISQAGIAADLKISWLSDRHFELVVRHPVTKEWENISDVGRGTSQVLPVIIGGYRLAPGDTYLVEEPEIHLHPRAQAALGDFFLNLTGRGVQTIVETHSEYLIMRLQQHVASGELNPDHVVFYYVGASGEQKTLTKLELDENAVFRDLIPGGFFPQRLEEAQLLARARAAGQKK